MELEGKWRSNSFDTGDANHMYIEMDFTDNEVKVINWVFSDSDCNVNSLLYKSIRTHTILSYGTELEAGKALDLQATSYKITPYSIESIALLNGFRFESVYDKHKKRTSIQPNLDWKVGVERTMKDQADTYNGQKTYLLYAISEGKLYLGDEDAADSTVVRPTVLDMSVTYSLV